MTNGQGGRPAPGRQDAGPPPLPESGAVYVASHRGAVVLTLGILGLVLCAVLGIIAWVMGNEDLRAMREGRMDRSGEGLTSAGRICGMISVLLWAVGLAIFLVVLAAGGSS